MSIIEVLNVYEKGLVRTFPDFNDKSMYATPKHALTLFVLGLIGELDEFYTGDGTNNDELGDVLWYACGLAHTFGGGDGTWQSQVEKGIITAFGDEFHRDGLSCACGMAEIVKKLVFHKKSVGSIEALQHRCGLVIGACVKAVWYSTDPDVEGDPSRQDLENVLASSALRSLERRGVLRRR